MSTPEPRQWLAAIARLRNCYANERELQRAVGGVLARHGIPHLPEHKLSLADRVDFLVVEPPADPLLKPHLIGLELKTRPNGMDVWRQLMRYAEHVDELVLVTTGPLQQVLTLSRSDGTVIPLTVIELWKNP